MDDIDQLKQEERAQLESDAFEPDETYSAEQAEQLKSEVEATEETPADDFEFSSAAWLLIFIGLIFFLVTTGYWFRGWWALILMIPISSHLKQVVEESQQGIHSFEARRALRGAIFGSVFMVMFMFNLWSIFFPIMLIGWGVSALLSNWLDPRPMAL